MIALIALPAAMGSTAVTRSKGKLLACIAGVAGGFLFGLLVLIALEAIGVRLAQSESLRTLARMFWWSVIGTAIALWAPSSTIKRLSGAALGVTALVLLATFATWQPALSGLPIAEQQPQPVTQREPSPPAHAGGECSEIDAFLGYCKKPEIATTKAINPPATCSQIDAFLNYGKCPADQ